MRYTTLIKLLLLALAGALFIALARSATWAEVKRWFYSVCFMAICFYTAAAIRAVAKFLQAKTDRLKDL